jgi:hypothetical protein
MHGWSLMLGWPIDVAGRQGVTVAPTAELMQYLAETPPCACDLPVGRNVIKRLRAYLTTPPRSRIAGGEEWWIDHADELADMTIREFAARYGVHETSVANWRVRIMGLTNRAEGWWQQEPARSLLIGHEPRKLVAAKLHISTGAVGRLRWRLRADARRRGCAYGQ